MPLSVTEILGFITGGLCVWLVVRENVWNWPIGLMNNVVFFVLFWQGRLYADMSLQVVYFILGAYGWRQWLVGGFDRSALRVSRTTPLEWWGAAAFLVAGTFAMREISILVGGAAPFWDALTTALSLIAQFLLCRKRFENWFFWIAADLIYVPLYLSRSLPLTAILYGVFLALCVQGVVTWRKSMRLSAVVPESA